MTVCLEAMLALEASTAAHKHRSQRRGAVLPVAFALVLASFTPFHVSAGVFPDHGWQSTSPKSQGLDAEKLKEAMDYVQANAGGPGAAESMVIRHGYVIWKGSQADVQHSSWSCSKSFASTVLGLLLEDGRCTLDTKALKFLPEIATRYPAYADITLRHFATMTSGYDGIGGGYADKNMDGSSTWFDPAPPLFAPGSAFSYWDDAQSQFGCVLTMAAGESLGQIFKRRIADPIGMTNWQWGFLKAVDGLKVDNAASGVNLSASDLARFGLLWLNQGVWNGHRLLNASWIQQATKSQVPGSLPHGGYRADADGRGIYGFNWWVNGIKPDGRRPWPAAPPRTYVARGFNNNVCFVVPEWDLVLVRMGTASEPGTRFDAFWDTVFGKLASGITPHSQDPRGRNQDDRTQSGTGRFSFPEAKPEHVGVEGAKLVEARDYALRGGGSGCILRRGRLVMAWGDQQCRYDIFSSTKSIAVTALGLAIMDGKATLHDKAQQHLASVGVPPDTNAQSGWLNELTLWHLATQTGGFEKTRGWCRQLKRPGTAWMYSDGGPNWLADCLTMAYGRDLLAVMNERVFIPLGITVGDSPSGDYDLHWGFNYLDRPQQLNGINRRPFGAGIHCNVTAMAKLGHLYLRHGRWQGKQILPEEFVRVVTTTPPELPSLPVTDGLDWTAGASRHYGLLWWNNSDGAMRGVPRDAFWALGMKESILAVIPSLDIVAVRAGDYLAPSEDPKRSDTYSNLVRPFLLPICQAVAAPAAGPLRVHPDNPRYFTDGTRNPEGSWRAVYLTGSHTWGNLCDYRERWPTFDFTGYLDFLVRFHHNFIRLWTGDGLGHQPVPYVRTGPGTANDGGLKVDLDRFDPAFFDRLRSRVIAARDRGLYVGIMLFSPDSGAKREDWNELLYHPTNNIQGINADTNGDASGAEAYDLSLPRITAYQEAYVRKVLDTVNDLDNVLYEIGNEGDLTSVPWQYHLIRFIKRYEASKPKQHPVGMTAVFNILKGSWATDNQVLFDSPADWISPGLDPYKDDPPAVDGKKVIIADVDHVWPAQPHRSWVWECFLRGIHPILMDWYCYGDPKWTSVAEQEAMRKYMGYTLTYANKVSLAAMTPRSELASTKYCLANPGREYLVYQPKTAETFSVQLGAGSYRYEWFNPARGETVGSGQIRAAGGGQEFKPPFHGEAVLYLHQTKE